MGPLALQLCSVLRRSAASGRLLCSCRWKCNTSRRQLTDTVHSILLYLVFFPYAAFEQEEDLTASITSFTNTKPTNSRRDPLIVGASIFIAVFVVGVFDGGAFVVSVVAVDDVRRHVSME